MRGGQQLSAERLDRAVWIRLLAAIIAITAGVAALIVAVLLVKGVLG